MNYDVILSALNFRRIDNLSAAVTDTWILDKVLDNDITNFMNKTSKNYPFLYEEKPASKMITVSITNDRLRVKFDDKDSDSWHHKEVPLDLFDDIFGNVLRYRRNRIIKQIID